MKRLFALVFAALFLAGCRTPALRTALSGPDRIDPHGGLYFDATPADLETAGIRAGDLVRVRLGAGTGTEAAVVPTFRCVSVGSPALVPNPESGRPLQLTIAYGCAALDYGLAERDPETRAWVPAKDIGFPLETEIVRTRAGGARAIQRVPIGVRGSGPWSGTSLTRSTEQRRWRPPRPSATRRCAR